MAITNTTYLGLNKPDYDAIADIEVLNDNADIIDEQFDGTHLVSKVNNVTPVGGAVTIDLGVTSVNGMTGAVTITERSVKQLIDIIYPVGSYYETTNANFNPNTAWSGTTWQRISDGRTLIAGGGSSGYTVGSTYGAKTHSITTSEMPSHSHTASSANNGSHTHTASTAAAGAHTHTRGTMNITGSIVASDSNEVFTAVDELTQSGALRLTNRVDVGSITTSQGAGYNGIDFDASRSGAWTGATSSAGSHAHDVTVNSNGSHNHSITVNSSGSGTAMSLVQPSQAVARWLRTA